MNEHHSIGSFNVRNGSQAVDWKRTLVDSFREAVIAGSGLIGSLQSQVKPYHNLWERGVRRSFAALSHI